MAITSTSDKLRFLSGLQANLPSAITNGTVYVTTDEHAMYVDLGGERIRLGDFIVVANVDSLPTSPTPHQSALYYAVAENILCRYNGTAWVQINSQKKLADLIKTTSTTYTAASNVGTATTKFTGADGSFVNSTLKVSSGNANTVTVTADNTNGLVINAADTIKSTSATVAENKLTVTETTSGYGANGAALTASSKTAYTLEFKNAGGTSISSTQTGTDVSVSIDSKPAAITPSFDAAGVLGIEQTCADGSKVKSSTITPTIKIGKGTQVQATFANGVANFTGVYTAAEVDAAITNQLKTANAMVFMGAVGGDVNLPASAAHGATYIVDTAGQIKDGSGKAVQANAQIGDLFIATGTETNGTISGTALKWQYVPSGDDDNILPVVTITDGSFTVSKKVGSSTASDLGKLTFSDGLTATASGPTLAVKHTTKTPTKNTDSANKTTTFDAISALTFDAYGHVSAYTVSTYTIPDNAISGVTDTIGTVDNSVEVTTKVTQTSGNNKSDTFKITSSGNSSILVTGNATSKTVNIDICWGTF